MIPGKMNSREMKRMMAQMGIKSEEMPDVKTVILKGSTKDYIISNAQVLMIEARGEKTFQIVGVMKEAPKSATEKETPTQEYNEDDLKLVIDQTGVSKSRAIEALKKANGQPAQAIIDLTGQ